MKISFKKSFQYSTMLSAAILFCIAAGLFMVTGHSPDNSKKIALSHPNILFIMVDQMQTPPEGYGPDEGVAQGLKEILGFRALSPGNEYTKYFPGLTRLRDHSVVFGKHYTSTAACVPSRACIMTGQYPDVTGVSQTDGLYKSTHDVPWLDSIGTPTIGDWFRAAGYTTHYFGKWHVSEVSQVTKSLDPWGFSDYESSYPEPHGGGADNFAGTVRDVVFASNIMKFLKTKATDTSSVPWLAVASFVNPHDIGLWPSPWQTPTGTGVVPWINYPPPPSIPAKGQKSRMVTVGDTTFQVDLNPDGFPQQNSSLPRTYNELLNNKPQCQKDYSYKWGLAQESNINLSLNDTSYYAPCPFQLQGNYASAWSLGYNQFYAYSEYLADIQIHRILKALDDNGLSENTIIVFLSDHGDVMGAHGGMIQKWHNAYEETIRVPMVISSPLVNANKGEMRTIHQPTSSIDLAPTLLALAGFDEKQLRPAMAQLHGSSVVRPFQGANLASFVKGENSGTILEPDGSERTGVLFAGNDMITEVGPHATASQNAMYNAYLENVNTRISQGLSLWPGPVRQPNNLRAFCTGNWKIVRYFDPLKIEPDEWELYCLTSDSVEEHNLVNFQTGEVLNNAYVPGMTMNELIAKNTYLKSELKRHEALATLIPETPSNSLELQLFQNYPNPFSQQTTIPFYVAKKSAIRLSIMDKSGKEVLVLLDVTLTSGTYNYEFKTGELPSGIYFIRLSSGSQQVVRKMANVR